MIGILAAATLAGLVGSPHCVGMCGGFALACGGRGRDAIPWHVGRMLTYAALGALAGGVGSAVPGPGWVGAALSALLIVWFSAALAGLVPEPAVAIPGVGRLAARLAGRKAMLPRLLFGMANGLLPCGLVYAALAIPVASADPLTGALAMAAFGLGTTPALSALLLGARRLNLRSLKARRAMALAVLTAGLWSIANRQGLLGSGPPVEGHSEHATSSN